MLTKILKKVIADGKGIEVNTSSFYYINEAIAYLDTQVKEKNVAGGNL